MTTVKMDMGFVVHEIKIARCEKKTSYSYMKRITLSFNSAALKLSFTAL